MITIDSVNESSVMNFALPLFLLMVYTAFWQTGYNDNNNIIVIVISFPAYPERIYNYFDYLRR